MFFGFVFCWFVRGTFLLLLVCEGDIFVVVVFKRGRFENVFLLPSHQFVGFFMTL